MLLHVIDVTHPKVAEQTEVVEDTLADLNLLDKPRILVLNKMDLLGEETIATDYNLLPAYETLDQVMVSGAKRWNLDSLLQQIESELVSNYQPLSITDPNGSSWNSNKSLGSHNICMEILVPSM